MEKVKEYILASYNELVNKVTWPTMSELQSSTILVLVASLIIALVIFAMDTASNFVLQTLIYG
ncbi:MAG: preprotein translocase subunit SecE [Saprospiraceae bacterium]